MHVQQRRVSACKWQVEESSRRTTGQGSVLGLAGGTTTATRSMGVRFLTTRYPGGSPLSQSSLMDMVGQTQSILALDSKIPSEKGLITQPLHLNSLAFLLIVSFLIPRLTNGSVYMQVADVHACAGFVLYSCAFVWVTIM